VACDIHAERHLAKAGGSKRKLRGIPHKRLLKDCELRLTSIP
jgi:hypothetical protein